MDQLAISPVCPEQPEGWNLDAVFVDWLTIRQPNNGRYPLINNGMVIRLDRTGEVVCETAITVKVPGSFDSSVRLRVTPEFLEISGNPSRFDKEHNLLGYRFEDAIEVFNRVLSSFDLPPLVESGRRRILRNRVVWDSGISSASDDFGFAVLRCDVTLNVDTGSSGNLAAYLRFLRRQTLARKRTSSFDGTIYFKAKSYHLKVYDKASEMRKHGLFGNRGAVADWCEAQGIARVEVQLNREYLRRNDLRYGLTHEKLVDVFAKEVSLLPKVCEEVDLDLLTMGELGVFMSWRGGFNVRERLPTATFYRYRKAIREKVGYDVGAEPPLRFEEKRVVFKTRARSREEYPDFVK